MEQGHGEVPDVVGADVEHHRHPVPGGEQPPLGAAHRLGRGRGPRGEQQHPQRLHVGLEPGVAGPRRPTLEGGVERLAHGAGGVVAVGEALRHEQAAREGELAGHRGQQLLVAGLGDEQLDVGVADVGQQVLVASRVVEAHDGRTGQGGAAQAEHVLGGVVEQHGHVRRPGRVEPIEEQGRVAGHLAEDLGVGPDAIAEAQRRSGREGGVGAVAAQERGGVGRGQRCFTRGRCQRHALGHLGRGHDMSPGRRRVL